MKPFISRVKVKIKKEGEVKLVRRLSDLNVNILVN